MINDKEKKSAMEKFALELYEKFEMRGDGNLFDELLEHAKKLHREEMISFTENYIGTQCYVSRKPFINAHTSIEEYFNITFGDNK